MEKGTILLSAGGTGGHLFPAEALAHEMKARGWSVHLATDARAERYASRFPADGVHPVASATFGSRNPLHLTRAGLTLWRGFRQASALLQRLKPKVVIGFGGYPTLPPLYAATRRGLPTLIHEQNAVMGRANRALAERVTAIAGGFLQHANGAAAQKIVVTGNPVRPAVIAASATPYVPPAADRPFHLLVFGGSQGAQFFSEVVPPAIAALPEMKKRRLVITQQARPEDEISVRGHYERIGVKAEISPFFSDMAERMAAAQLILSRSGASTVSEIAIIGRPAFLVPYPHALDHDQAANAAALAAAGGAEVHRQETLSAARLAGLINTAMEEPKRLSAMAASAKSVGKPNAAQLLADLAEVIAAGRDILEFRKDRNA